MNYFAMIGKMDMVIKSNRVCHPVDIDTDCEIIARKIVCSDNKSLIVASTYRPPNNNSDYASELCRCISDICRDHPNSTIWVGGDFNLPDIDWSSNSTPGHQYTKKSTPCS